METVGFEMYTKLLEETVRELKGEDIEDDIRATVNLRVDLKIDEAYIPDMNQRLMVYRRIASARSEENSSGPSPKCATATARHRSQSSTSPTTGASASWPTGWASRRSIAKATASCSASAEDPARPGAPGDFLERRTDVTLVPPAGLRLDSEAGAGERVRRGRGRQVRQVRQVRPAAGSRVGAPRRPAGRRSRGARLLVDGPGNGGGSDRRVHEGRDPEAQGGRPSGPQSASLLEWGPVERAPHVGVKY